MRRSRTTTDSPTPTGFPTETLNSGHVFNILRCCKKTWSCRIKPVAGVAGYSQCVKCCWECACECLGDTRDFCRFHYVAIIVTGKSLWAVELLFPISGLVCVCCDVGSSVLLQGNCFAFGSVWYSSRRLGSTLLWSFPGVFWSSFDFFIIFHAVFLAVMLFDLPFRCEFSVKFPSDLLDLMWNSLGFLRTFWFCLGDLDLWLERFLHPR